MWVVLVCIFLQTAPQKIACHVVSNWVNDEWTDHKGWLIIQAPKSYVRWPLNYCLYGWWHYLAGNTHISSYCLNFQSSRVRICPVYLSEFIVSKKRWVWLFLSHCWHTIPQPKRHLMASHLLSWDFLLTSIFYVEYLCGHWIKTIPYLWMCLQWINFTLTHCFAEPRAEM